MRLRALAVVLLTALWTSAASPAWACRGAIVETPIMFEDLPIIPDHIFAADVDILKVNLSDPEHAIEAGVITMLAGGKKPKKLIITYPYNTSCDRPPIEGEMGVVVGMVISKSRDEVVIKPFRAPSDGDRAALKRKRERFVIRTDK